MRILFALAALALVACDDDPPPSPQPDTVERICTPANPAEGTPEVCVCKTANEATECPADQAG